MDGSEEEEEVMRPQDIVQSIIQCLRPVRALAVLGAEEAVIAFTFPETSQ